jgi:excinuclease ABC subunit C
MDKEKLKNVPDLPGVYVMKDKEGGILYIGKAASLKKRVLSYFRENADISRRIGMMAAKAEDIAFFVTGSEAEALILEAALIKKHKPRYNVALKDDKSYPYLELTKSEDFPRLIITPPRRFFAG